MVVEGEEKVKQSGRVSLKLKNEVLNVECSRVV